MSTLLEVAWNVLAVIGALTVLGFGAIGVLLVQVAVENRARRNRRRQKAADQLRTDITAFELLTSVHDVFEDGDHA